MLFSILRKRIRNVNMKRVKIAVGSITVIAFLVIAIVEAVRATTPSRSAILVFYYVYTLLAVIVLIASFLVTHLWFRRTINKLRSQSKNLRKSDRLQSVPMITISNI